uniref:Molybdate-anion transporter n=2 Tax=Steinernema glaseri TaxID=37863 RepID=A0A1I7ZX49_9BILA
MLLLQVRLAETTYVVKEGTRRNGTIASTWRLSFCRLEQHNHRSAVPMAVNLVASGLGVFFAAFAAIALFLFKLSDVHSDAAQRNVQFRYLQRKFIVPYLIVLFAESLQAPYLYVLYHSYGFQPTQIGVIYVMGLVSNAISSLYTLNLLSKCGRRLLCLVCVGAGSVACLLKFSDSYLILLISRILDGFCSATITLPFHQWYTHEHLFTFDFPREWVLATFGIISVASGFLSIAAGFFSDALEVGTGITAFPFFGSTVLFLIGGFYVGGTWKENRLLAEMREPMSTVCRRAIGVYKNNPIALVLSVIHCFFEATIVMFIFVWTPLFLHCRHFSSTRLKYGAVYATFMGASLFGTVVYRMVARRVSTSNILIASTSAAFFSTFVAVQAIPYDASQWSLSNLIQLLIAFSIFEAAIGVYLPIMSQLQSDIYPAERRTALLSLVRIPMSFVAACGILLFNSTAIYGELHLLKAMCILTALALILAILLHTVLQRKGVRRNDPDHLILSPSDQI